MIITKEVIFDILSNSNLQNILPNLHNKLKLYDVNYKINYDNVISLANINVSFLSSILKNIDNRPLTLEILLNYLELTFDLFIKKCKINLIVVTETNTIKILNDDQFETVVICKINETYHPLKIKKIKYSSIKYIVDD